MEVLLEWDEEDKEEREEEEEDAEDGGEEAGDEDDDDVGETIVRWICEVSGIGIVGRGDEMSMCEMR
ncbi:hypothetical protein K435DRAFT_880778 [Dendrothele bispora CBS 962.96]|uniref:Uncharacterized protein n=1 Tax=Dendrothele bispora (strain CBS 962.96) TaxID=1314807 RepID=A0A4S8KJ15_DENBC|nr:hypothetical protein K435DRAFT_880778 [Dendrothele bispora CBS 962.96]